MAGMVLQSPLASGVRTACPGCCAEALLSRIDVFVNIDKVVRTHQLILWLASGVSNEGGSSPLLALLPAVSWPWVLAWGSLEPPRRGGENAQKRDKTEEKRARYGLRSVNKEGTGGINWQSVSASSR